MLIQIRVPEYDPRLTRYIVQNILQGAALGCRPFFVGPDALPPLYSTHVKYELEPDYGSGVQTFMLPPELLEKGKGSCGSLSVYETARRQAKGQTKVQVSVADYLGNNSMHAQFRDQQGDIQDPSLVLGAVTDWPENFLFDRK